MLIDQMIAEDEANKQRLAQQATQLRQMTIMTDELRTLRDELDVWRAKVRAEGRAIVL